jgi:hypothetical protein
MTILRIVIKEGHYYGVMHSNKNESVDFISDISYLCSFCFFPLLVFSIRVYSIFQFFFCLFFFPIHLSYYKRRNIFLVFFYLNKYIDNILDDWILQDFKNINLFLFWYVIYIYIYIFV